MNEREIFGREPSVRASLGGLQHTLAETLLTTKLQLSVSAKLAN